MWWSIPGRESLGWGPRRKPSLRGRQWKGRWRHSPVIVKSGINHSRRGAGGVYSGTYILLHSKWMHSLPWSRTTGDIGPLKRKLLGGTWQKSPRIYFFYNLRNKVIKVKSWLIASPRTTNLHSPFLSSSWFPLILILSHLQTTSCHQKLLSSLSNLCKGTEFICIHYGPWATHLLSSCDIQRVTHLLRSFKDFPGVTQRQY